MVQSEAFAGWFAAPRGVWPLARITTEDAAALGARTTIADLSAETARKQALVHGDLTAADYAMAQTVVDHATRRIQDTPQSLIYLLIEPGSQGHVLVVKATRSGEGLFVTSFRRLSRDAARRDRELNRLLGKALP